MTTEQKHTPSKMTDNQIIEAINGLGDLAPDWLKDVLLEVIELRNRNLEVHGLLAEEVYHHDNSKSERDTLAARVKELEAQLAAIKTLSARIECQTTNPLSPIGIIIFDSCGNYVTSIPMPDILKVHTDSFLKSQNKKLSDIVEQQSESLKAAQAHFEKMAKENAELEVKLSTVTVQRDEFAKVSKSLLYALSVGAKSRNYQAELQDLVEKIEAEKST